MLRYVCVTRSTSRRTRCPQATRWLPCRRLTSCLLCDSAVADWQAHRHLPSHQARVAICTTFATPERGAAIMQQLQRHIHIDFASVDAATQAKVSRRHTRLRETLRHLVSVRVLERSLPQVTRQEDKECWVDRERFMPLVCLGEAYAWREGIDRVARLMPSVDTNALSATVAHLLSTRELARLVDALELQALLVRAQDTNNAPTKNEEGEASSEAGAAGAEPHDGDTLTSLPPTHLTQEEKATVLLAMLGELQSFSRKDRSHHVLDKAAADELVHNVLATHAMQNIISELVHGVLQRVIDECTPVWEEYEQMEQAQRKEQQQQQQKKRDESRRRAAQSANAGKMSNDDDSSAVVLRPALQPRPAPRTDSALHITRDADTSTEKMTAELQAFLPDVYEDASSSSTDAPEGVCAPAVFVHPCPTVHVRWDKLVTLPSLADRS